MRIVDELPRPVREIEHAWIPVTDGVRLAARLWIPADAVARPVPAILEKIPYGKRDGTRERDEPMHRWFAGHGVAAVRVDVRGAGDSEGLLEDEYSEQELADAVEVIAWIARQPWCTGAVGMMGKSWGGFNALQVAARRPPALKAVISCCASDDRFADDAHFMGGCLLNENLTWGTVLMTCVAQPPDPALVGESWRRTWLERLEAVRPFPAAWMRHPARDAYWRRGSAAEELPRLTVPAWLVGGWADAYTNAVPRLLAGLPGPRRALVGPWAHLYPHEGVPGPAVGFLQEALAWWRRWLEGRADQASDWPAYRAWCPEPGASLADRPGRWIAEDEWPSPRLEPRTLHLAPGRLQGSPSAGGEVVVRSPLDTGLAGGAWCSFGLAGDLPGDQREDDGRSACFDTEPLGERLEILGDPEVELELSCDRPRALVAVRLCDVAPDGVSRRVTYALLNLQHRDDPAAPTPVPVGRLLRVRVRLGHCAWSFPAGHRARLAVSTSYWPVAWPSPEVATLRLRLAAGRLVLPVRPPRPEDAALRALPPPEGARPPALTADNPHPPRRVVSRDLVSGEVALSTRLDADEQGEPVTFTYEDIALTSGQSVVERYRVRPDDPLSAWAEVRHVTRARRGRWGVRVALRGRLTGTADELRFEGALDAREGDRRVLERTWDERVPRQTL